MNTDCLDFRGRLADALRGRGAEAASLSQFPWQQHVMHCAECRALLAEEEALEELLVSLPRPHLPPALAHRVLLRLESARRELAPNASGDVDLELDALLDLSSVEPAPSNLARGVRERVRAELALDRLLELDRADVPAGVEQRVLARLRLARAPHAKPTATTAGARGGSRRFASIAAGLAAAAFGAWILWGRDTVSDVTETVKVDVPQEPALPQRGAGGAPLAPSPDSVPDEQMLASLELLEAWDLVAAADGLDASLATWNALDEVLLDFEAADVSGATDPTEAPAPSEPNNAAPRGDRGG